MLERWGGFRAFFDNAFHEGFISSGNLCFPLEVLLIVCQVVLQGVEVDGSSQIVDLRGLSTFRVANGTDPTFETAVASDSHVFRE